MEAMTVQWTPGVFPFVEGREYTVDPETGCWNWALSITQRGYPQCARRRFKAATGTIYGHRQGYIALYGPLPPEIVVHHRCHNPHCINPDHLEATRNADHLYHHRQLESELTEADVLAIREAAWDGTPIWKLAEQWGLAASHIGYICDGTKWPHVGGPIGQPPKTCEICGGPVTGSMSRIKKYCSPKCNRRANYLAQRRRELALTATEGTDDA